MTERAKSVRSLRVFSGFYCAVAVVFVLISAYEAGRQSVLQWPDGLGQVAVTLAAALLTVTIGKFLSVLAREVESSGAARGPRVRYPRFHLMMLVFFPALPGLIALGVAMFHMIAAFPDVGGTAWDQALAFIGGWWMLVGFFAPSYFADKICERRATEASTR